MQTFSCHGIQSLSSERQSSQTQIIYCVLDLNNETTATNIKTTIKYFLPKPVAHVVWYIHT